MPKSPFDPTPLPTGPATHPNWPLPVPVIINPSPVVPVVLPVGPPFDGPVSPTEMPGPAPRKLT